MSLSQDEINALLTGDESDDDDEVEIMRTEDIEAMLDPSLLEDDSDDEFQPADADLLSTEDIDALLGDSSESTDSESEVDLDELFGRLGGDVSETVSAQVEADDPTPPDMQLTEDEIDILGEIGNISMGAVATTMYALLDKRVSITTPRVTVYNAKEVLSIYQIPFVVATIEYVEGITGNNLLVLRVEDAALITDILTGGTGIIEGPVVLNEIHLSAMSEIMNQMMGASSTSLSKLLGRTINISTPKSSQVNADFDVTSVLGDIEMVTKISFDMEIDGLLKSELIQLMPYEVSREFAKQFLAINNGEDIEGGSSAELSLADIEAMLPDSADPSYDPVDNLQQDVDTSTGGGTTPAESYQQQSAPQYSPPPSEYQNPGRMVDVHPMQFQAFDSPSAPGEYSGIDLVYDIPLQVSVELGKTRKEISEILEFGQGTIVVLDKIAGDPVEIVVNGKLIARGEVVVIDENYGVRITDIIHNT